MKVNVLGCDYTIVHDKSMVSQRSETVCGLGRCDHESQKISLNPSMPKAGQGSTLVHEVIEAINGELELALDHKQITGLSCGLYQVLVANPVVFTKIMKQRRLDT